MSAGEASTPATDPDSPGGRPAEQVSLRALFNMFFWIGASSFGGGTSSWIYRETVAVRRWLSQEEFLAGLALGQILPGANVSNVTVYIGNRLRGGTGAVLALAGLIACPFIVILLLAQAASMLSGHPTFVAALDGVAASAVGLVLNVAVVSARQFVPRVAPTLAMVLTFVAIAVLHWSLFLTVGVIAPLSVVVAYLRRVAR